VPYTKGPYSTPSSIPAPDRPELSDSRGIQFSTGTYITNSAGGFDAMPPIAQRVLLLVAFAGGTPDPLITPQAMASAKDRIRKALSILTSGKTPAIRIDELEASRTGAGTTGITLRFKDLTTSLSHTVQL
jgi:hypothetical protein